MKSLRIYGGYDFLDYFSSLLEVLGDCHMIMSRYGFGLPPIN